MRLRSEQNEVTATIFQPFSFWASPSRKIFLGFVASRKNKKVLKTTKKIRLKNGGVLA